MQAQKSSSFSLVNFLLKPLFIVVLVLGLFACGGGGDSTVSTVDSEINTTPPATPPATPPPSTYPRHHSAKRPLTG